MKRLRSLLNAARTLFGRGVFPHEASFILELGWRNFVLAPRELAARLPLAPSSRVLEVGAGAGFYSAEVARRVPDGRLELLDLQPEMLRKAEARLTAAGFRNVGYTSADASRLPFADGSLDLIYMVAVLGEVSDGASLLRECRRVLRTGATLSVSEHLPDPDFSRFATVKSLVEPVGFALAARHGKSWSYTANFTKI